VAAEALVVLVDQQEQVEQVVAELVETRVIQVMLEL
tara:strand:+ start:296 stop:403 length:108 start_codon:yes stop_codon:yes gene_type:complete